jgi:hypothetical protein
MLRCLLCAAGFDAAIYISREEPMTCQKCKGLMIEERQPELSPSLTIHRCINCGLVVDPLMLQNRLNHLREKQSLPHAA